MENHPLEVVLLLDVGLDERVVGVVVLQLGQVAVADLRWLPCVLRKHHQVDEGVRIARILVDGLHQGGLGFFVLGLKQRQQDVRNRKFQFLKYSNALGTLR